MFKREEILSFVMRDYSCYTWSVRSLDRRPRHILVSFKVTRTLACEKSHPSSLPARVAFREIRQEQQEQQQYFILLEPLKDIFTWQMTKLQ